LIARTGMEVLCRYRFVEAFVRRREEMNRFCIQLVALILALPLSALAQTSDAAYCAELSALARRYIADSSGEGRSAPSLDTQTAINDCAKGNTAAGIPVLERKLRANGFTLPKRS